jgi:hypothetical protein
MPKSFKTGRGRVCRVRAAFLVIGFVFLTLLPSVGAQQATDRCTAVCDPHASDANGPGQRTEGPVKVFLYANLTDALDFASLRLVPPDAPSRPPQGFLLPRPSTSPSPDNCVEMIWSMGSNPRGDPLAGDWRTHQDPGLAADVALSPTANEVFAYVRLNPATAPAPSTSLMMLVRVETGRFPGHGRVLAQGSSALNPSQTASAGQVLEFRVPLQLREPVWPGAPEVNGFLVQQRLCQIDANGVGAAIGDWRWVNGPAYTNRLVLNLMEPLAWSDLSAHPLNGRLFLRGRITGPFGVPDIDRRSVRLVATGDGRRLPQASVETVIVKVSVDHDGRFKPVNATFAINRTDLDGARDWLFGFSVDNTQGTFEARGLKAFSLAEFKGRAPGFGPVLFLLAAIVAIGLRRSGRARTAR